MVISKHNLQSYLTKWVRRFTWYHPVKNSVLRFKILIRQSHATEGFVVQNVDTAPSIHEYLGEFITSHLRVYH